MDNNNAMIHTSGLLAPEVKYLCGGDLQWMIDLVLLFEGSIDVCDFFYEVKIVKCVLSNSIIMFILLYYTTSMWHREWHQASGSHPV